GDDAVFARRVVDRDRLGGLRKQVDDRGATKREGRSGNRPFQAGRGAAQIDENVEGSALARKQFSLGQLEVEEQELLGKGEEFREHAERQMRAAAIGQQALVL